MFVDKSAGVALGHRRLAVIELSERGAQPMHSADGRSVFVFNGEIYNHLSLRHELEAGNGCADLSVTGRKGCFPNGDRARRATSTLPSFEVCGRSIESWLRESEQSVEWIFCLTAARVLVANQEQR